MIPYIKVPDAHIGPLTLHPFGILVATGVLVGTTLTTRRARRMGYDLTRLNSFITWMLVAGFIGGHVLDELFYHWDKVIEHPYTLALLWEGLSSFGGFTGALIGIVLWKFFEVRSSGILFSIRARAKPQSILAFADLVLSVFPIGWIFGRAGCSTVHDHPGAVPATHEFADTMLAVAYPSPNPGVTEGPGALTKLGFVQLVHGQYPRYDLGLLELMFTVIVAACFVLTWRRRLPVGSYVVATAFAYSPVRFAMDFLRIPESEQGDTRYAGLTPAQWCCVALFVYGVVTLAYMRRLKKRGIDLADTARVPQDVPATEPKEAAA
jgi:phosphatidylglycerol:prolipoprotein diacylglycerol transferase